MIIATPTPDSFFAPLGFFSSILAVHRDYKFIMIQGANIAHNRNTLLSQAKDDILMIDSDMVFTPQDVKQMEEDLKKYDVVCGVCPMINGENAVFDKDLNPVEIRQEVFEIGACGAAFLGISKRIHDKLPDKPFDIPQGSEDGEDTAFCKVARGLGFKIYCDGRINIGHIKHNVIYP